MIWIGASTNAGSISIASRKVSWLESIPMPKILLHIGPTKTGTTSIQWYLENSNLEDILYPKLRRHNHNILSLWYKELDGISIAGDNSKKRIGNENHEILRAEVHRHLLEYLSRGKDLILSSELMANYRYEAISALKRDLDDAGYDDVAIITYIRNPADRYISSEQQKTDLHPIVLHPDEFRNGGLESIRCWEECFPDSMIVRAFDKDILIDGDVVADFIHEAELFFRRPFPVPVGEYRFNQSRSAEEMTLVRHMIQDMNIHDMSVADPKLVLFNRYLKCRTADSRLSLNNPVLKPEIRAHIESMHREEYLVISRDYNPDFLLMAERMTGNGSDCGPGNVDVLDCSTIVVDYEAREHIRLLNMIIVDLLEHALHNPERRSFFSRVRGRIDRIRRRISLRFSLQGTDNLP